MKKMTMKIYVLYLLVMLLMAACASQTDNTDKQLTQIQKELLQLKAQNTNLRARTEEMDDELLVYRKKEKSSDVVSDENRLKTVRLSPESSASEPGHDDGAPAYTDGTAVEERSISFADQSKSASRESSPRTGRTKDDRPVLRLYDYDSQSHGSNLVLSNASAMGTSSATRHRYADVPPVNQGDNLGVVRGDGLVKTQVGGSNPDDGPMETFNSAYRAYNNNDYESALAGFAAFLKKGSAHGYADNAMFWRAECYLALGKMFKAIGEFERLVRRYPNSEKVASSYYRLGFMYDKLSDKAKAKEYYFKVVDKFPGSEAARKASRRMASIGGAPSVVKTSAKR